jgi:predicted esterase
LIASLTAAVAPVAAAVADAARAAGFPRARTHLFGYGGGGVMALALVAAAARGEEGGGGPYGSCVSIGGVLPPALRLEGAAATATTPAVPTSGTPTLITRGERDRDVPAADAAATAAALRAAGCDAAVFTVPGKAGGMIADAVETRQCMLLWARTLKAGAPGEGVVEVGRVETEGR